MRAVDEALGAVAAVTQAGERCYFPDGTLDRDPARELELVEATAQADPGVDILG